jgi:eukaryotic-like serine/threonine-protein kinase
LDVNEAHGLSIIHRDLKPGNLFVTETSDHMPFVKVLDFGISKTTSDEPSVTASAAVIGSPLYMSPEQLLASGKVDARSDVWSLAVILYEMLAAKSPFHGESVAVIAPQSSMAPIRGSRPIETTSRGARGRHRRSAHRRP